MYLSRTFAFHISRLHIRGAIMRYRRLWVIGTVPILLFSSAYYSLSAPANFSPSLVVIARGATTKEIAHELADARVIRHPLILEALLRALDKGKSVQAGTYRFESPQNLTVVARRLATGDSGLPLVRMTFIEGATASDMIASITDAFPTISAAEMSVAEQYEGYLFPDTYFFPSSSTADSIVKIMRENFEMQTGPIAAEIVRSGRSISDVIIMASLIEKEARSPEDKRIIAGILWRRLDIGMPLQVDAARETYEHKGLPPAPIANPGLDTIKAALHPTETDYFYYLTGKDGLMHYASTFPAHQTNKRKYLN